MQAYLRGRHLENLNQREVGQANKFSLSVFMTDKKRTIGQQRERERKRESFLLPRTRRTQHKFKFRALIKKIAFILFCGD